jgi:glucose/arabinose dehydrogenase
MKPRNFTSILMMAALAACSTQSSEPRIGGAQPSPEAGTCSPLETRAPNAPGQQPAFVGQTRACATTSNVSFDVTVLASGLVHPWSVEPMPDGNLLVTERPGRLRIISASGQVGEPIAGLPAVEARSQGGLLDVALSPDFASDRTIFFSFSEPRDGGNGTSVARAVLSADRRSLEQVRVIFRALPAYSNAMHFGSRLAFDDDGKLYITTGERSDRTTRPYAQRMDSHLGKILRINPDGSVPSDNPFVGQAGVQPEIWTVGHRNVQASAFDPDGRFWIVEHGTNGGDELNLIEKGENYGWPVQAYGEEYNGSPIEGASTAPAGMEQPR